ncbi:hypothetical protein [Halobellus litoreus]|uniref:Uncharacterized protein n=1 Tax=Halobellus litoreus TaxID=755310 RepID=A0ABD6DYM5_9EURY|nr:hypothetical protein [Halobellus litoreus]
MAQIDIPTAVLAVLVSVTLSPVINLLTDGLKGFVRRTLEQKDRMANWNHETVELAKEAKIIWATQYQEQDTSSFDRRRTWSRNVQNRIRQTKSRLLNHAQSAPPGADEEVEQSLMELIAACEGLSESDHGRGSKDEFEKAGKRVKENAEEVIRVTPHN